MTWGNGSRICCFKVVWWWSLDSISVLAQVHIENITTLVQVQISNSDLTIFTLQSPAPPITHPHSIPTNSVLIIPTYHGTIEQHLTSSKEVLPCPTKHSRRYVKTGTQIYAPTWRTHRCSCPLLISHIGSYWTIRLWRNWTGYAIAVSRFKMNKRAHYADMATHTDRSTNPSLHSYWRVFILHRHWAATLSRADSDTINHIGTMGIYEVSSSPMSRMRWKSVLEEIQGETVLLWMWEVWTCG